MYQIAISYRQEGGAAGRAHFHADHCLTDLLDPADFTCAINLSEYPELVYWFCIKVPLLIAS